MSLNKYKSHGKAVEVTVNSKEENSYDFCLDLVQEFGSGRENPEITWHNDLFAVLGNEMAPSAIPR
jgi:hypothetical protein